MSESLIEPIECSAAVLNEFRQGFKQHAVQASLRQEQVNAYSRRLENSSRLMDGIGQLKYRIDADLYAHMKAIFGPDCWKDPAFTDALERDGVIQRVKGISDKIMSFATQKGVEGREIEGRGLEEAANNIIAEHTFPESDLPPPSTEGTVDGTEVTETIDQAVS
jgi:hypothetical protein